MEQVYIIRGVKQVYFFLAALVGGNQNWTSFSELWGHEIGGIRKAKIVTVTRTSADMGKIYVKH